MGLPARRSSKSPKSHRSNWQLESTNIRRFPVHENEGNFNLTKLTALDLALQVVQLSHRTPGHPIHERTSCDRLGGLSGFVGFSGYQYHISIGSVIRPWELLLAQIGSIEGNVRGNLRFGAIHRNLGDKVVLFCHSS